MTHSPAAPEQALHKLYSDHSGWLRHWLQRKLGCPQSAADLAQDTFLKVLLGREAHRILEPRAFLTTLAKRVLANHYRRQDIERAYLLARLREHDGNVSKTAEAIGMERSHLHRKLKTLGVG